MSIYTTFEKINLTKEPGLNEKWVQDRIAENPAILGLGELILRTKSAFSQRLDGWICFYKIQTTHDALKSSYS